MKRLPYRVTKSKQHETQKEKTYWQIFHNARPRVPTPYPAVTTKGRSPLPVGQVDNPDKRPGHGNADEDCPEHDVKPAPGHEGLILTEEQACNAGIPAHVPVQTGWRNNDDDGLIPIVYARYPPSVNGDKKITIAAPGAFSGKVRTDAQGNDAPPSSKP
jgi:hypothetical protein